jgi:hypothetical protein
LTDAERRGQKNEVVRFALHQNEPKSVHDPGSNPVRHGVREVITIDVFGSVCPALDARPVPSLPAS